MSSNKPISRRIMLRGAGVTLALPWLEALSPARASRTGAGPPTTPPMRMAFLYVPNGMHMPDWTPAKTGKDFKLPSTLQPLAPFRSHLTVLSGLTLNGARALGDGGGDHARSVAAFLTGAHPKKTDGEDIHNGTSVDQLAASRIGTRTRLPSVELGLERSAQAGRCDSGYSCLYTSNMSWRSPTSPVAKEINPAAVFDRLFDLPDGQSLATRAKQHKYKTSILDLVVEDAKSLQRKLGAPDQRKLEEYLFAVRDVERRIMRTGKQHGPDSKVPNYPRPKETPRDFEKHARLMFDLMALAFQTDATRIITFMYTNAGSNRAYPQIGVRAGHHNLSHHGNDPKKQAQISKINHYHVTLLTHLIGKLASFTEGNETLLDHCMVMYGSGIGDGNRHNHDNLPIILLGKGRGTIDAGRHLKYARNTPLTNLYVSMLERMGVDVPTFGDSTGKLNGLGRTAPV